MRFGRLLSAAGDRQSASRITEDGQARWCAFARTGVPGADWPHHVSAERAVMIFEDIASRGIYVQPLTASCVPQRGLGVAKLIRSWPRERRFNAVTGPRELVHGERESFIGGYRWQRSGLGAGSPVTNAGGGCTRVSSR